MKFTPHKAVDRSDLQLSIKVGLYNAAGKQVGNTDFILYPKPGGLLAKKKNFLWWKSMLWTTKSGWPGRLRFRFDNSSSIRCRHVPAGIQFWAKDHSNHEYLSRTCQVGRDGQNGSCQRWSQAVYQNGKSQRLLYYRIHNYGTLINYHVFECSKTLINGSPACY